MLGTMRCCRGVSLLRHPEAYTRHPDLAALILIPTAVILTLSKTKGKDPFFSSKKKAPAFARASF